MGEFLQDGGANSLAKLVNIPIIAIVYDTQMTIFRWVYKPTNITGGLLSCGCIQSSHDFPLYSHYIPTMFALYSHYIQYIPMVS